MSMGLRGFVEYLENRIKEKGILGSEHNQEEIENDVISMVWDAYEEWKGEE